MSKRKVVTNRKIKAKPNCFSKSKNEISIESHSMKKKWDNWLNYCKANGIIDNDKPVF